MQKLILALIAGSVVMASAHAEGPYVGVGLSRSSYNYDINTSSASAHTDGKVTSRKLFGGYDFGNTWSIEGGYIDLGKANANYLLGGATGNIRMDGHTSYVAGKFSVPLNESFSAYAKLGLANTRVSLETSGAVSAPSSSASRTGVYAGIGAQWTVTKNAALSLELERSGKYEAANSKAEIRNANSLSLNASFKF